MYTKKRNKRRKYRLFFSLVFRLFVCYMVLKYLWPGHTVTNFAANRGWSVALLGIYERTRILSRIVPVSSRSAGSKLLGRIRAYTVAVWTNLKALGSLPGDRRFSTVYPDTMRRLPTSLRRGPGWPRCPHCSEIKLMKGKALKSIACTRKQQHRFYWSCSSVVMNDATPLTPPSAWAELHFQM